MDLPKRTLAAQLRREVEARTGTTANMAALGWQPLPGQYSKVTGAPLKFTRLDVDNAKQWMLQRTTGGSWYITRTLGTPSWLRGKSVYHTHRVKAPLFPGPVAAAIWLAVEIENGSVRFDESKSSVSPAGTVLRDDPA